MVSNAALSQQCFVKILLEKSDNLTWESFLGHVLSSQKREGLHQNRVPIRKGNPSVKRLLVARNLISRELTQIKKRSYL